MGLYHTKHLCAHATENVRFATAEQRCAAEGLGVCGDQTSNQECSYDGASVWTPETCTMQVAVDEMGKVSAQTNEDTKQNKFQVSWDGGFPTASTCPSDCAVSDSECVCDATVELLAVFDRVPDKTELA